MADYWQPTAEGYFGNVPKVLILEAVREAIGPGAADKIASLKKDAMAKRAAALIKDKGWLPGPIAKFFRARFVRKLRSAEPVST